MRLSVALGKLNLNIKVYYMWYTSSTQTRIIL